MLKIINNFVDSLSTKISILLNPYNVIDDSKYYSSIDCNLKKLKRLNKSMENMEKKYYEYHR